MATETLPQTNHQQTVDLGGSWFNQCQVTMAGPAENGTIYIALQEPHGLFGGWYVAHESVKREMLQVALTALQTGKKVQVYLDGTDVYSTIYRLYLQV